MTTEQKPNKLIDLLIEYSQDWEHFSDPNQRLFLNNLYCKLKELKTEEIKPDVTTGEKIDDSIDVRYEPDLIEMFNKFIRKWCGKWYPHLIDTDENDGQFIRDRLVELTEQIPKFKDMPNWNKLADKLNKPTPWLPNPGDGYYTIHPTHNVPIRLYWGNPKPTNGELALHELGLIFETQEEAEAKIVDLLNL